MSAQYRLPEYENRRGVGEQGSRGEESSPPLPRSSAPLLITLALYLLITLGYSVINPLFEAPDEHFHYFTVQSIVDSGRLPVVTNEYDELLGPEPAQPPLYYLLGALLIAPIDTAGAREQVWLNDLAWIGTAEALTNVNRTMPTAQEAWPWQGYALAGHLLRALSILFGLGTLLCIYSSGRLLWPGDPDPALLATALVAFLPQFNFIHAAVTNDSLITFLSAAAIWQLLRLWQTGTTRPRLLLLGVTVGLAALTKNAGVLLLLYSGAALALLAWRQRRPRLLLDMAIFVVLPAVLLTGWLWWRNWMLYGDWTAANQFVRMAGGDREYSLLQVLGESNGLWLSLFAIFGWFNVRAPEWVYWVWNGMVIMAIIGAVKHIAGEQGSRGAGEISDPRLVTPSTPSASSGQALHPFTPSLLLFGWALAVYAGLVGFMMQTEAAQGRLLFPALVPLALGLAYGLSRWRNVYWIAPLPALATTLYCLFFVIAPTYAGPPLVNELPAAATPLSRDMGQGLTLVGARVETPTAEPGDVAWLTLYWQADSVPDQPPAFKLELFGRDLGQPVGEVHSYHGRGLYPANLWPPDQIVADRFGVRLDEEIAAPVLARTFVRLVEAKSGRQTSGAGEGVNVGAIKIAPTTWPPAPPMTLAQVGDSIELAAVSLQPGMAQPGSAIQIDVTWRVTAAPGIDYTTLVHLAEAGQPPLATGDSPPLDGDYPTRVWAKGEVIEDSYSLALPADLPAGSYPVWIGMYESATITPLPLLVDGVPQPDGRYLVGWVEVGD
jgi:4-amino-4-deoxy-L-arabinose transferase-like glycosyltransferase